MKRIEYLDQIVLLWSLFQQAIYSCSWEICETIEKDIDNWIDRFFAQIFSMEDYEIFYDHALHALLSWKPLQPSVNDTLGRLKYEVSWPILSREIAGELTPSNIGQ